MKDWLFIRYIPAVGTYSIQMSFETSPPGTEPVQFALGRKELTELVEKAQRALSGDCPELTLAEFVKEKVAT